MGQLFAVVIGDNSAVELAEREVRRLLAEMEDARGDAELLNSLSAAHAAAQRHLEAVQQGVNSPEALGRMINLVEAQFDQARLTISQQFERVQAEVSAMSAGVQSLNQAAAAEELGRTVESLLATERAQNTVSAWMAGGEAGPVNAADVANVGLAGGALTSTVPQPTSQRRTSGTRSAVVRKGGEKR
ncbi:hypothetical protein HGA91_00250 [candidate division WWE3 bacterium]|nr:hypothetical protein [candidate division WWE3 bacterium]